MLAFLMSRHSFSRLAAVMLMAAQVLGWVVDAQAAEPAATEAAAAPEPRAAVRRALREFDRFLDHHPLQENQLRLNPALTASPSYLARNPELRDFLRANATVGEGLKVYPRYFLNRALLRQASAPLSFAELAPLRDVFLQQPAIEQELVKAPDLIRSPDFLTAHPVLRECFVQHPALARVFLPVTVTATAARR
ncbi:MAG: hypothetical protein NTV51_24430 [Verrucomicrobia bacterium]|nr:hypothetical protein [Verrucomicrobiota bacterium]